MFIVVVLIAKPQDTKSDYQSNECVLFHRIPLISSGLGAHSVFSEV
jgi:hypothetical protein